MLLAIDTSAGTSVAVVNDNVGILSEHGESDTRRHAEVIGTLIRRALADAGIAVTDLTGVAVGMGPGPFTGLRVGIAAARAFALGINQPVIPVVSHDGLAFGRTEPVLVVTDARRREVYWSAYSGMDAVGLPVRTAGPGLCAPDRLAADVPGFTAYRRVDAEVVSAAAIGLVAQLLQANQRPFASGEALYLRSPDVTLSAGPKRVS
ncbi:MAG TPA: tRNA (adenosine(37)-N6)-threonylcarbamoyltransferase complex dimerization subunit type 1 TsaB [Galbitalea sp.]|nr:tRNA (adenosine(37)-N6)-threonylcarbamoyltransferase complex dimerization subunit type 1 TsaB [Galbitalea sp.]